jgi:hypothetical protein
MESLSGLLERRDFECRLTPGRALQSLAEAEDFLLVRGLLTRTADCALPSLYGACHEEPYQPGGVGFASWPATKWSWFGELIERGHLCVAVHRGKNLLVSLETATLLDPICRAETSRVRAADPGWRRLLDHLEAVGPSDLEDVRFELDLKRQELKALRSPLERCGVIVARSATATAADGHGHTHTSELSRWDQAFPNAAGPRDPSEALADLLVAAVRAAVVAPEAEVHRWFSWPWYWSGTLVEDLVSSGRLRRVDGMLALGHVSPVGQRKTHILP